MESTPKSIEDDPEGIIKITDKDNPPKLNKVKKRCLILSPTVNAGLEPESKISDFEKEREIGKGGFGLVWKVIHKKTQKVYCIKVIEKQGIIQQKLVDQMNREIKIMYILNHPHCLRLKNHFEDDQNFYLVMPLAHKGQLYRILRKFKKFDEKTAAQILRETISALQYLHSFNPPIIHRDIKPENLLLNNGGRVLLADFGWSNFNDGDVRKTFCGTPEYIAPEMLSKKGHDTRVDIWSIGVLMFELLAGYSPFVAKSNQDLYLNIKKLKIQWPKDMPPLAKNLIGKILRLNPSDRPSLEEILNHQWFKQTKMIKPLLENKLNTKKDLLVFHMLNEPTEQILERINTLLNLSGKDADNTNAKNIIKENPDSENVIKKNNIMKQIKANKNNNNNNKENKNKIEETQGKETPGNNNEIKKEEKNNSEKKQNKDETSFNENTVTGINVSKEQKDLLLLENAGLKKDNELYKTKLLSMENELRNLKAENSKLQKENATSLQELIKKRDEEIEKLNSMNKDRINILSELEEKTKINMENNNKIQVIKNEKAQKEKMIETIKNRINDLNKQLEFKDNTINEMSKKNEALDQEKEKLFLQYQKKIEELQSKVLNSKSQESNKDDNTIEEMDLSEHMDSLNTNIDSFKSIFNKKINSYKENFETFKSEFKTKDETFNNLLLDKTKTFNELLKKYSDNLSDDISKLFNEANKPISNVKEQKIDWLNKQVDELSEYKKKGIYYDNKNKDLVTETQILANKNKINVDTLKFLKENLILKDDAIASIKQEKTLLEQKCNDLRNFILRNANPELKAKFNQAGF